MPKGSVGGLVMVLGGLVGGWGGYWIDHLAGWSTNAVWPARIGGGTGAILLSIGLAAAGAVVAGALLDWGARQRS